MSDTTDLLEIARTLSRRAEADEVLGDPVPVTRKILNQAATALQNAYTALQAAPTPEESAATEIAELRRVCRWFAAAMDLDDEALSRTMPPELLPAAAWLWRPTEVALPELPPTPELSLEGGA